MSKIKVAIIEDHPVVANAIADELNGNSFEVNIYKNLNEVIQQIRYQQNFDIVISDLRLDKKENALDSFAKNREIFEKTKLIIYSSYISQWLFIRLLRMEIMPKAVIEKTELPDWENLCLNINNGGKYLSATVIGLQNSVNKNPFLMELINFSERKWEVLKQILQGNNDKEIAENVFLSKHTVNDYRKQIYKIVNVNDAPSLIKFFQKLGYYEIEE